MPTAVLPVAFRESPNCLRVCFHGSNHLCFLVMCFLIISAGCYMLANGIIILLILVSELGLFLAAKVHIFIKRRWQSWEGNNFSFFHWFFNLASRFLQSRCVPFLFVFFVGNGKQICPVYNPSFIISLIYKLHLLVVKIIRFNPLAITTLVAVMLICFVHPALGLFVLVLSHCVCCHSALCSYLIVSFSSCAGSKELVDAGKASDNVLLQFLPKCSGEVRKPFLQNDSNCHSTEFARSFGETQLEIFHHRHGLLILHFLAALMFLPSMVAWMQRSGSGQSFPCILESVLCIGVLLHGICDSRLEFNFFLFPFPGIPGWEIKLSFAYLVAGFYSYLSGLDFTPYKALYAMAVIGLLSFAFRIVHRRNIKNGETFGRGGRRHSHRH